MADLTNSWLDYAWDVVSPTGSFAGHRAECVGLGGAFTSDRCKPQEATLRLPGYLGENFGKKLLLFVGAVHNGNQLFTDTFRPVETASIAWRSNGRSRASDRAYLSAVRSGYSDSMPQWGPWTRGFGAVIRGLNLDTKAIAYTNVAKCWSWPRQPSRIGTGVQDDQLMEFCSVEATFDISRLVRMLKPLQIYVSARNVFTAVDRWSSWEIDHSRVWVFNANTGALLQGNKHVRTLHDASAQYQFLKSRRSKIENLASLFPWIR